MRLSSGYCNRFSRVSETGRSDRAGDRWSRLSATFAGCGDPMATHGRVAGDVCGGQNTPSPICRISGDTFRHGWRASSAFCRASRFRQSCHGQMRPAVRVCRSGVAVASAAPPKSHSAGDRQLHPPDFPRAGGRVVDRYAKALLNWMVGPERSGEAESQSDRDSFPIPPDREILVIVRGGQVVA